MNHLDLTIEILLNSMILSVLASLSRLLFTKITTFIVSVKIFVGGIVFGVLAGYLANDIDSLQKWIKIIIVVFSCFGKELFEWLQSVARDPIRGIQNIRELKKHKDDVN